MSNKSLKLWKQELQSENLFQKYDTIPWNTKRIALRYIFFNHLQNVKCEMAGFL